MHCLEASIADSPIVPTSRGKAGDDRGQRKTGLPFVSVLGRRNGRRSDDGDDGDDARRRRRRATTVDDGNEGIDAGGRRRVSLESGESGESDEGATKRL